MRSQKKNIRLSSFLALQKYRNMQIDIENDFEFKPTPKFPVSCSKFDGKERRHQTQQSSPVNKTSQVPSSLPHVQNSKSSFRLSNQKEPRAMCSKTVQFLDSLINILKEEDLVSVKLDSKRRLVTDIPYSAIKKPCKKPKIIQNGLTKMFFNSNQGSNRNIQSEECSRKPNPPGNLFEEFTFYGNLKEKLSIPSNSLMKFRKECRTLSLKQ